MAIFVSAIKMKYADDLHKAAGGDLESRTGTKDD